MIWTGLGFLVVVIAFGLAILSQSFFTYIVGTESPWMLSIGYLMAAVVIWLLGKKLNSDNNRVVIDKKTGKEFTLKSRHTLFFVDFNIGQ